MRFFGSATLLPSSPCDCQCGVQNCKCLLTVMRSTYISLIFSYNDLIKFTYMFYIFANSFLVLNSEWKDVEGLLRVVFSTGECQSASGGSCSHVFSMRLPKRVVSLCKSRQQLTVQRPQESESTVFSVNSALFNFCIKLHSPVWLHNL